MEIIKYPLTTEKCFRLVQANNALTFVVDRKAAKQAIKHAVETMFAVKVKKVNTQISANGEKRAYVMLSSETPAMDVITRLGLM